MDLYILDENFNTIDVIDDFEYLLWDTAFYKRGFFEVKAPITRLESISSGRYVYRSDNVYTGRINTISLDSSLVTASGSFLEGLLDFRVDISGKEFTGSVETAMFNLVRDSIVKPRAIPGLTLGKDKGRGRKGTFSAFGKSLAKYFYELAETYSLSFNIKYLPDTKTMEFNVIEGLNRTQSQDTNSWCIFSRDFGNVYSEYFETNTDYPNFAHVFGEDKSAYGSNKPMRERIEIDETNGEERRELFVDGGDLRQEEGMSNGEYIQLLRQRGYEKLAEAGRFETIDFVIENNSSMPFELGDICTYKHTDLNKIYELQVTEIKETHENGGVKRNVVLGRYNPGIVEAMKKGAI